jgi:AraC family transcriptional regulator of adaptative response / DNA-3-methyladenine glycosylase II
MPTLDPKRCASAYQTRDARFDGRFFAGITTTRIFCRPICPAPRPRPEHLRFYASAAEAAAAGYRPCRRCRPESAPGSAAWSGTAATVARALKLIDAGVLERDGIEALAERLGLGARQLRRLFAAHLGASPRDLSQRRRVERARELIVASDVPMTEIAARAGFGSVRQFNDVLRRACGAAPTAMRRRARRAAVSEPRQRRGGSAPSSPARAWRNQP